MRQEQQHLKKYVMMPIMTIWGTMPVIIIFCFSVSGEGMGGGKGVGGVHLLVHHLAGVAHGLHARRKLLDLLGTELTVGVVAEIVLEGREQHANRSMKDELTC